MTDKTMRQQIKQIPGDQGWWHRDGERTYLALAKKLREHDVPADVVVDVLTDAYAAAAGEFGG